MSIPSNTPTELENHAHAHPRRKLKAKRAGTDVKKHKRVNDILLGPLERPALQWLAAHMPAWVNPDILTGIGFFGSVLIGVSYWLTHISPLFFWLASLGFVINWFGDSLDGTLARYRKIERPKYGFFVDHSVDAISETIVFVGLGLSPYVRIEIALMALITYLLMSVLVYLRTYVRGQFVISYGKLGPTEARVIAIIANTAILFAGNKTLVNTPVGGLTFYDLVGLFVIVLLGGIFLASTLRQIFELGREAE